MAAPPTYRKRFLAGQGAMFPAIALVALVNCDLAPDAPAPPDRTLVVAMLRGPSGLDGALVEHYAAARGLALRIVDVESAADLFAKVATGRAHVGVGDARLTRRLFVGFDVAFAVGPAFDLAWAVAPNLAALRDDLDRYFDEADAGGTLRRLAHRYLAPQPHLTQGDADAFRAHLATTLPRYQAWFEEAEAASGIEWRLIAAVAYQESRWDPAATSETGVRGFMQVTAETAQHLDIDRLDTYASIMGAARYLAALKARLPARIADPDRTLLALAAYNIGAGHLEDARIVAQRMKGNPDRWEDVREALPLLALPEHYESARNGYARGGMPVAFVDRVGAYHNLLVRHGPLTLQ
jgi:membrane-bound lytic murein transglycosylase F